MAEVRQKRTLTPAERLVRARDCADAVRRSLDQNDSVNAEELILRTYHEGVTALELHRALNEAGIP